MSGNDGVMDTGTQRPVAIIGCGLIGAKRAHALRGLAPLVALHDLDGNRAARLAGLLPGSPVVCRTADEAFDRASGGLAIVATAAPIMLRSLGGAAGVALLAALLTQSMHPKAGALGGLGHEAALAALGSGLQTVFACAAAVVLMALLACTGLRPARSSQPAATEGVRQAA